MAGAGAAGFPRLLQVQALQCLADEGFWDALRRLKLDVLGTDDSPIPITGPPAPNPLSLLFVRRIRELGQGTSADPMRFHAPLPGFRRAPTRRSCLPVAIRVCGRSGLGFSFGCCGGSSHGVGSSWTQCRPGFAASRPLRVLLEILALFVLV